MSRVWVAASLAVLALGCRQQAAVPLATELGPSGWTFGGPGSGELGEQLPTGLAFKSASGAVALYRDVVAEEENPAFTFSAWVRSDRAGAVNLAVASGKWWAESQRHSGGPDWELLTVHGVLPPGSRRVRLHVWARDGAAAAVRDASMELAPQGVATWPLFAGWGVLAVLAAALFVRSLKTPRPERWLEQPENLFLVLGAGFGLTFLVTTPPLQVPDENAHFYRAAQLAQLEIHAVVQEDKGVPGWGAVLPVSFVEMEKGVGLDVLAHRPDQTFDPAAIGRELRRPLEPGRRAFIQFGGPAMYAPVPYLPQLTGVGLGRVAGASPLLLLYLARLFNLAVWLCVVRLAIRTTPVAKWGFFALALSPMSLFLAGSASPDVGTSALAFLTIATILSIAFEPEQGPLAPRRLVVLIALCVALALAKQVYLLLSALLLLVPPQRLGGTRRWAGTLAGIVGLQLAANAGWWAFAMRGHSYFHKGAEPSEQLGFIVSEPVRFAGIFFSTLSERAEFYVGSFVGNLGWLDTPLPDWLVASYVLVLSGVAVFFAGEAVKLRWWHRTTLAAVAAAVWVAILVYLYLIWTAPRAELIEGCQGRYLIPLAPLVVVALGASRWSREPKAIRWPLALASSLILTVALSYSVRRFFA